MKNRHNMDIEILSRSKTLPEMLKNTAMFYAKELRILDSNYKVFICTDPNLRKDGSNGLCAKTGDREITVALYSRLSIVKMLSTLAHEMVHVKQMVRGHYRNEPMKYGKGVHHYWLGKRVKAEYIKRPWELEAFRKELVLLESLGEHITKKMKNKTKKS